MPGMHSGLNLANPVLVAAFRSALMHQGLAALLALATLAIIWACLREWRPALVGSGDRGRVRTRRSSRSRRGSRARRARPAARGSSPQAAAAELRPAVDLRRHPAGAARDGGRAAGQGHRPGRGNLARLGARARELGRNRAGRTTRSRPVPPRSGSRSASASGCSPRPAVRGRGWPELAGVAWGLVVWVFGEAFGGVLAPGLTVLFGAPGAALFYCLAGALVALPERSWRSAALGRRLLAGARSVLPRSWPSCRPGLAAASGRAPRTASRAR